MRVGISETETEWQRERSQMVEKLRRCEAELTTAKEKVISTAEQGRRISKELEAKNQDLMAELKTLERSKRRSSKTTRCWRSIEAGAQLLRAYLKTVRELQAMVSELKANGGGGGGDRSEIMSLRTQLRQAELEIESLRRTGGGAAGMGKAVSGDAGAQKRIAALVTEVTVLKSEMQSYEKYMKGEVIKLKRVKKECAFWKEKAISLGASSTEYSD